MHGGKGRDRLVGGSAADIYRGYAGRDRIEAIDSSTAADTICEGWNDIIEKDKWDKVIKRKK